MTYRDILARKERRDPVTNRPVWPLQTQEWASRRGHSPDDKEAA
ncbi:hypothetical protein [Sphingomonas sp. CCH5-D11]|nr:hypothetical protein [Sphingomonas sp. CCH5-D11]